MRIFHVITLSSVGGAQSVVVNLANEQARENEVWVLSSASGEAWAALDAAVRVIKIKQLHRNISWRDGIVLLKLLWYRFRYRPDVVHLHSSKMGALGRVAFPARKIVYTVHGFDTIRVANRGFLPLERFLQRRCAHIVGVSRYDERMMASEGITRNVSYVYNGIKDLRIPPAERVDAGAVARIEAIRGRYRQAVMCIARDDKQKKIDLFIRVAALLPEYAFVWIGNKGDYEVSSNVFLLGQIPLGYQLLEYADLFVLPTNYEGLPMSIIEALCCGKPVVASDVGGISELLDGTNGVAVENDAERMAERIRWILSDSGRYARMSQAARETFLRSFTVEGMVNGYQELYNRIYLR